MIFFIPEKTAEPPTNTRNRQTEEWSTQDRR